MILIISDKNDIHARKVENMISEVTADYVRFDLDVESLKRTIVRYKDEEWEIIGPNGSFVTSKITTVWNRRTYVELYLEESEDSDVGFKIWKGEWNKTLLGIYASLEPKKWLNFYRDAYYAENKYRQFIVAKTIGFNIPNFICSNEKTFLYNQFNDNREKVIKFMNQDFYKTDDNLYKGLYVNKIKPEELDKFQDFEENPIVLQDYISKEYEVRYTVVGDDHFVCKIDSQASKVANVDWRRYDLPNTPHSIIEPPKDIRQMVIEFMKAFNLNYGALDFIVTPNDDWYFLEINSMGQFLWIEDLTGLKISKSISNWLISNN